MDSCHCHKLKIPNQGNYDIVDGSLLSHHENTWKRIALIFLPQFFVCAAFILYVFAGSFAFRFIDEDIAKENYTEVVLFSFTTLATIGYGNISPKTTYARLFCLLFTTLGVPLCVVVIGNLSKHLTKAFWMIQICFGINMRRPMGNATLPMTLILILYFVVFMFGCLIYPEDAKTRDFSLRNLYFSVVSFATVGFGDESPNSSTWQRLIAMFFYLTFGMILSGMMFSVIHHKFRRITKVGTKVNHASDVTIWFGSESMKVSKFLKIIAEEFNANPSQIHEMLHGLDELLEMEVEKRDSSAVIERISEIIEDDNH